MSAIAVCIAVGTPSVIALAGVAGLLANRNVDMAEMPKHNLSMFSPLGSALFGKQLVRQRSLPCKRPAKPALVPAIKSLQFFGSGFHHQLLANTSSRLLNGCVLGNVERCRRSGASDLKG